jgi:hypothetical protein
MTVRQKRFSNFGLVDSAKFAETDLRLTIIARRLNVETTLPRDLKISDLRV